MKLFISIILLSYCTSIYCQKNTDFLKNVQQSNAVKFIQFIEKEDSASAFKFFDNSYLKKIRSKLPKFTTLFNKDFKSLPSGTKRYITLVMPDGINLFRFRYVDSTGVILTVDVSYKIDISSKIIDLGLITTSSLKKERQTSRAAGYDFN